ncbi:hypothetical protein KIL84_021022 [Mauremys mutica]|uniref:Uncharacterized protein n=1 Tax=Mauremys mutica TaxID=74926 RepID=A0A9D3XBE6_9SAUR|nr:hypothetical protein KIL84_021022 [Mauremys mutica]
METCRIWPDTPPPPVIPSPGTCPPYPSRGGSPQQMPQPWLDDPTGKKRVRGVCDPRWQWGCRCSGSTPPPPLPPCSRLGAIGTCPALGATVAGKPWWGRVQPSPSQGCERPQLGAHG